MLAEARRRAAAENLTLLGGFHPAAADGAPTGARTLVLVGPDGPGFWARFRASPEAGDGRRDPLDRWSARVVASIADALGATAVFPFGGPPHAPFLAWAQRTGEAWPSPVGMLVHARLGLFVSYRGALAFRQRLALPSPPPARPCDACARPCLGACPADALGPSGYDVASCHAWLDTGESASCLTSGCAARRACPVGAGLRTEAQSAFHMADFHGRQARCED